MTNSPAHAIPSHLLREKHVSPTCGGNWPRRISSPPGPFSSPEPVEQFLTDGSDTNEAAFLPVYAAAWRARRQNRRVPAKSRPSLPFIQVNDIFHSGFSVAHNTGDRPE